MSISEKKKNQIKRYLLEKIDQKQTSVVKKTAEAFGVTPATVYKYLDDMEADGTIKKIKRGTYILVTKDTEKKLKRDAGEIESELKIYNKYIYPELQKLPKNVQEIWDYLCGEMLNNIIDHSSSSSLEIYISQSALHTAIWLVDDGIGIFEKIRDYFGLSSLDEAVGELFKGKLTTDARRHSGEGIFFSSRLADAFLIISSGRVFSHDRFDGDNFIRSGLDEKTAHISSEKGTTVYMELSNFSQKRAKDVFDLYADVDGGFTKTRIPLKNYFENDPVSRSQAKRLCSGLENFHEIELDMSGISWMGQGFAHQVFVVFQNEHPDIKLIPLNMNEDVQKMYYHVTH